MAATGAGSTLAWLTSTGGDGCRDLRRTVCRFAGTVLACLTVTFLWPCWSRNPLSTIPQTGWEYQFYPDRQHDLRLAEAMRRAQARAIKAQQQRGRQSGEERIPRHHEP